MTNKSAIWSLSCRFAFDFLTKESASYYVFKGTDSKVVDLIKDAIKYTGPKDLSQYYVRSVEMTDRHKVPDMAPDEYGVRVEIVLGRRTLNQLLTTYIPTMCICLVAFSSNIFRVGT